MTSLVSEGGFDFASAERLVAEYTSLQAEASLKDLHFSNCLDEAEEDSGNASVLLKRNQDYIRKLKSNFLELETKARFLEVVLRSTSRESIDISEELLAETEIEVAHAKNKLKKVKAQAVSERAKLETTVSAITAVHEQYTKAQNLSASKVKALAGGVAAKKAAESGRLFLSSSDDSALQSSYDVIDSIEKEGVEELIRVETRAQQKLKSEMLALDNEIQNMQAQLAKSEGKAESLQSEVTQLNNSVQNQEEKDTRRVELREVSTWFTKLTGTLSNLTGVRVIEASVTKLHLRITPTSGNPVDAFLAIDRSSTSVTSVRLEPLHVSVNKAELRGRSVQEVVAMLIMQIERTSGAGPATK